MKTVTKNGKQYNYDDTGAVSCGFFTWEFGPWEPHTFNIFDKFCSLSKSYIDIGAWIGPTVLYATQLSKKAYCVEPDPVAHNELMANIQVNESVKDKIIVCNYALADRDGTVKFGGNGNLGNSMSGIVDGTQMWDRNMVITVPVHTFEHYVKDFNIDLDDISIIKIDIEGGEKFLIPNMLDLVKKYRVTMYLSLHWCFLVAEDVVKLIEMLYDVYPVRMNRDLVHITKEAVIHMRVEELVLSFEE